MSTAPVVAVDWEGIKGKMLDDAARGDIEAAQAKFEERWRAARAVGSVPPIDWESYQKALPGMDLEALQKDFEAFMKAIPDIEYDPAADRKMEADTIKELAGLSAYAQSRSSELEELQAEADEHKLHDHYTVARVFQRYEGMYEREWREWQNLSFDTNLRQLSEAKRTLSTEDQAELLQAMSEGLNIPAHELIPARGDED